MADFHRKQQSLWRLDRNYKVLQNQRLVLETLQLALQIGYGEGDWYDKSNGLLKKVAEQVYRTCDMIWQDAGIEEELGE